MKIELRALFTVMIFFIVTIAVIELHDSFSVQHETAIETISEFESCESEFDIDPLCVGKSVASRAISSPFKTTYCENFILIDLPKGIFRPPRLVLHI